MHLLKTVLIGVTASSDNKGSIDMSLTELGFFEMRHALQQLKETERRPRMIFCSTQPAHIASAHMLGTHGSVDKIIPCKVLCFGRYEWYKRRQTLKAEFVERLKTPESATEYLAQLLNEANERPVRETEEVLVLTGECWGGSFKNGHSLTWPRGALYSLDLATQDMQPVGEPSLTI